MGSAQSARRTQPGDGPAAAVRGRPSGRPGRGAAVASPGALSPWRCVATGSGSAWTGSARRWVVRLIAHDLYSAPLLTSPFPPGPWTEVSLRLARLRPGTGPSAPGATVDLDGLPPVRPDRVAPLGRGSALV